MTSEIDYSSPETEQDAIKHSTVDYGDYVTVRDYVMQSIMDCTEGLVEKNNDLMFSVDIGSASSPVTGAVALQFTIMMLDDSKNAK